ncbi:MAG: substrate-binding domain-containing protein [Nitrospirota bacterium]
MIRMKYFIFYLLLGIVIVFPSISSGEEFVVIVNKENPVKSMSMSHLKRIYLKSIKNWDTGEKISPLDMKEGSSLREVFYRTIFNKGAKDMSVYWLKQRITKNIKPPVVKSTDTEIKDYVSKNRGAVGYIEKSAADNSVQVVEIR